MKNYSLRSRLIVWISIPALIAFITVLALNYYSAREEIEEIYDAQLVHSAKVLLQLTEHEILEDATFHLGLENSELHHRYERKLGFRIWYQDEIILQTPFMKQFAGFEAPPGFSTQTLNGQDWRFFVFLEPGKDIKIEVSELYDIRLELIMKLMASMIIPASIFIPVMLLIIWTGVRQALTPVVTMSRDIDLRSSNDLSPLEYNSAPREVSPFILALNRLFKRLEESFLREREFTDHAAHELRTPLAAMKTQTQVLIRKLDGLPEYRRDLENLHGSINRATHLIEQLLLLARIQNDLPEFSKLDLTTLIGKARSDIAEAARHRHIRIETKSPEKIMVTGHEFLLEILLRNLLDNAVKYSPEGSSVHIIVDQAGNIDICDMGPGLSDHDKAHVFDRFVRVDKTGQTGSGLGLTIAKWIAQAHNMDIRLLDNDPHGTIVRIIWQDDQKKP